MWLSYFVLWLLETFLRWATEALLCFLHIVFITHYKCGTRWNLLFIPFFLFPTSHVIKCGYIMVTYCLFREGYTVTLCWCYPKIINIIAVIREEMIYWFGYVCVDWFSLVWNVHFWWWDVPSNCLNALIVWQLTVSNWPHLSNCWLDLSGMFCVSLYLPEGGLRTETLYLQFCFLQVKGQFLLCMDILSYASVDKKLKVGMSLYNPNIVHLKILESA